MRTPVSYVFYFSLLYKFKILNLPGIRLRCC